MSTSHKNNTLGVLAFERDPACLTGMEVEQKAVMMAPGSRPRDPPTCSSNPRTAGFLFSRRLPAAGKARGQTDQVAGKTLIVYET